MPNNVGAPAPRPCSSCPYRQDVPSGIWARSEYTKLAAYDAETWAQPTALFLCHQTTPDDRRARMCAGWAGCHGEHLLALRLAVHDERITPQTFVDACTYQTTVPLFASGTDAATHGITELDSPNSHAVRAIAAIERRRDDVHPSD